MTGYPRHGMDVAAARALVREADRARTAISRRIAEAAPDQPPHLRDVLVRSTGDGCEVVDVRTGEVILALTASEADDFVGQIVAATPGDDLQEAIKGWRDAEGA